MEETVPNNNVHEDVELFISLGILSNSFHIFGFLDDTGFRTTTPCREIRENFGFYDDIHRSF